MDRQVYVRSKGSWKSLEAGLKSPAANAKVTGFESIHGLDRKELYAVGWAGEIWHFNGRIWKQADSPTNLVLSDVTCTDDGTVYAVGQKGTVIVGRDRWDLIEGLDYDDDLLGVAWQREVRLQRVHARGQYLSFIGARGAYVFYASKTADGTAWQLERVARDGSGPAVTLFVHLERLNVRLSASGEHALVAPARFGGLFSVATDGTTAPRALAADELFTFP